MAKKKVTAFMGSPRKHQTYKAMQRFEKELKAIEDVDFEYVFLKECNLQVCKGCFLCLTKGEEFCPLKDDRDLLIEKLHASDGVIFTSPNYSLQVTAIMKNFLDRLAFVFHRPRFFHKAFMGIVTQGVYGGGKIVKYLEETAGFWGFNIAKGVCLTTLDERTPSEEKVIQENTRKAAERFHKALNGPQSPRPSLFRTAIFRITRAGYRAVPDESSRDYRYFRDNGWFESEYYYKTSLGILNKALGVLVDAFGEKTAKSRDAELKNASQKNS